MIGKFIGANLEFILRQLIKTANESKNNKHLQGQTLPPNKKPDGKRRRNVIVSTRLVALLAVADVAAAVLDVLSGSLE